MEHRFELKIADLSPTDCEDLAAVTDMESAQIVGGISATSFSSATGDGASGRITISSSSTPIIDFSYFTPGKYSVSISSDSSGAFASSGSSIPSGYSFSKMVKFKSTKNFSQSQAWIKINFPKL